MSKIDTAWKSPTTGEVYTPRVRMVYPTLITPRGIKDDPTSKPRFTLTGLIPKSVNIDALKAELTAVLVAGFGKDWVKKKNLKMPLLRTEDQEKLAEFADDYPYILRGAANADFRPTIVNPDTSFYDGDGTDIYSGRWAIMAGKFWSFKNVSNGVSFGLNRVQLLDNDEPIAGGRVASAEGFETFTIGGTEVQLTTKSGKRQTTDDLIGDVGEMNDALPF